MSKTSSAAALLHICIQDLHAGKRLLADRLPALRDAASDGDLVELLSTEIALTAEQAERLATCGADGSAPENLWMKGILDDADRDTRSHQAGDLLDIALIGAVRKAKAAETVSSETAIALARKTEQGALLAAVVANRREESEADARLRGLLEAIAGAAASP